MATKPGGGAIKALVAGPLRKDFFCGFPYGIMVVTNLKEVLSQTEINSKSCRGPFTV